MSPTLSGDAVKGGYSLSSEREYPPFDSQEKGIRLAVSDLNDSYASGMGMPARGGAAFSVAIRFASAPTIRCCAAVGGFAALRMRYTPCGCRSAHLVEVRSNSRLPPVSTMRRAKQCRYFARSLPPSKRHSRLTIVRRGCNRERLAEDSWRSHVHRTYIAQRVQLFEIETANVKRLSFGRSHRPFSFSGKKMGGVILRRARRITPRAQGRARNSPLRGK